MNGGRRSIAGSARSPAGTLARAHAGARRPHVRASLRRSAPTFHGFPGTWTPVPLLANTASQARGVKWVAGAWAVPRARPETAPAAHPPPNRPAADALIPYLPLYYCLARPAGAVASAASAAAVLALTAALFRALGATAEVYLGPTMTGAALALALPPRLAGGGRGGGVWGRGRWV